MLFISEHRLIFKVTISGTEKLVAFSEPNVNNTVTTFRTDDDAVIAAIRRHKFYRDGKIREKAEPKPVKAAKPKQAEKMMFDSFTHLKNYLIKTYNATAKEVKTPKQAEAFAKAHQLDYAFPEQ